MKKMKLFYINDGTDGIVVAKSLKHACNLVGSVYQIKSNVIEDGIKRSWRNGFLEEDWSADMFIVPKKGKYKKARILGWYNN